MGFPATPRRGFAPHVSSKPPISAASPGLSTPPGGVGSGASLPWLPIPHPEPHSAPQVVFRYALAIFKYNEEALLRLQDSLEIYQYLHLFTKTICDSR